MHLFSKRKRLSVSLAALTIMLVFLPQVVRVGSQQSDPIGLSYQTFSQLDEKVYRAGGEAPALVAKLNLALAAIDDAQIKRAQGDSATANRLEDKATSILQSVLAAIPTAQQQAASSSASWTLMVFALVPIVVISSTLIFLVSLLTWRQYERMKLYEMRIVEKKPENQP